MNKLINPNSVSVICEIASAHGGDSTLLKEMLNVADSVGADWVKVQVYQYESLVAEDNTNDNVDKNNENFSTESESFEKKKFGVLKTIELQPNEWIDVIHHAGNLRPKLIAEVFDLPSLQLIADEKAIKAFKISTSDLGDRDLIDAICELGKPIFVGVGGATILEIDEITKQIAAFANMELVLLHGIQSFPTELKDSLLSKIRSLKLRYGCEVGFADHIDAEDTELARTLPAMAMAAGATFIEKHITLDRSKKGFDYYSALNPTEFSDFITFVKNVNDAIGTDDSLELTDAEIIYRKKIKKFAVLNHTVAKGSSVKNAIVKYKRTSSLGMTRQEFEKFRNKVFVSNYKKNTVLTSSCFY
jgi:N,N'-diacetyllegionaminate synthase